MIIEIFNFLITEICIKYNIPYIEVYKSLEIINKTTTDILRDEVHTTDLGSELYGKFILEWFNTNIKMLNISNIKIPDKNIYNKIKIIEFNEVVLQNSSIKITGKANIVGIFQEVGPFSCWVDVYVDNKFIRKQSLIDQHCYYTRQCFNFSYSLEDNLTLNVVEDFCDYSVCKRPKHYPSEDVWWVNYYKDNTKCLKVKKIYYIGDILDVVHIQPATTV